MLVANDTIYVRVNVSSGSSLTLRSAPSSSAAALGYLQNGEQLTLLAFDDDWACVCTSSGLEGFAARKYLLLPGETAQQPTVDDEAAENEPEASEGKGSFREIETDITICNITAYTRTTAKLYKSASASSTVLKNLDASVRVQVMAYNSEWAYVNCGGKNGYVLLKYLKAESER